MARRRIWRPRCFLPLLFAFYVFLSIPNRDKSLTSVNPNSSEVLADFRTTASVEKDSLTAIFPVTLSSLPNLRRTLSPFLKPSSCVAKAIIVCPEHLLAQSRAIVRELVRSAPTNINHPDISVYPSDSGDPTPAVLKAALHASTEWLLLLDETGFDGLSERTRGMLLCPVAADLPTGPRGALLDQSCAHSSPEPRLASYLLPPFTLPRALAQQSHKDWSHLGRAISGSRQDRLGGIIHGYGDPDANWCNGDYHSDTELREGTLSHVSSPTGFFVFLLPDDHDLRIIMPLPCRLNAVGHSVRILLYSGARSAGGQPSNCNLRYDTIPSQKTKRRLYPAILDWLERMEQDVDIIFTVDDPATQPLKSARTLVRVPREDLAHVQWMGSLTLIEWMNWNVPQIEASIITQDRPESLERLVGSLSRAKFFGDSVNLRINMEQSSDLETIRIVSAFKWKHGSMFTHRRVVHGGLLPAVVESWYPHSNDSYGLLLEDDVELSPLFYAWIKMSILRYRSVRIMRFSMRALKCRRYGKDRDQTAALFGISLYQQNNIELHPEGRKPFNARNLFMRSNVLDPSTPYLSQIPCSWGAVYFPEHWREFHEYLAARLSESTMDIEQIVVPDVRSNNWTKSWKKYFIEMVYLRGYVMLYPNYEDFVSLSTNHLEVGSHVKERPKEKQEVFRLPLMKLEESAGLLNLPGRTLPEWRSLPVLNLTGSVVALFNL